MEQKPKVLYVTSEITPFLKLTSAADTIRILPQMLQDRGYDVRVFMPKFGLINERRLRLHEVVRLSGINIRVAGAEKPLTIKVASVPNARLQVYFLDNEDYFKRKYALQNKEEAFYADNDERAIFFCKGVIETVKKLGWSPNIIHCHGWFAALLPLYLRTLHKDDPVFKHTKIVYTAYNNGFPNDYGVGFLEKVQLDGISEHLDNFAQNSYVGISKGAMKLSDIITKGHSRISEELESYILECQPEKIYFDADNKEAFVENYNHLYVNLVE